jgi:hypothetical protein
MNKVSRSLALPLTVGLSLLFTPTADAAEKASAERGAEAVRGKPSMNPSLWSLKARDQVWKVWGLKERPADHAAAFRARYGLHEAPYDNNGLPMGLHEVRGTFGKGISTDCLLCHAGAVAGQTIIGLANNSLEMQALFDEMSLADGNAFNVPFRASHVRGPIDPIGGLTFLIEMRDAEMNIQKRTELDHPEHVSSDPPAWWQIKKKKVRNWNGGLDARSTRVDIATLLHPFNSGEFVRKQEGVFGDIHAFVLGVESPRYPFAVDEARAAKGREVFNAHCSECHGTHGKDWTYPSKVVPLKKLGTDPTLARAMTPKNLEYFNKSWLAQEKGPDGKPFLVADTGGYLAPPLDGVWATAPYLHNSSVPTVYHVLNSKARPAYFTRSYGTAKEDYDPERLGVKHTELKGGPDPKLPPIEQRKVYDTTRPGQSNAGHPFGDDLSEAERMAVIEYLKTL